MLLVLSLLPLATNAQPEEVIIESPPVVESLPEVELPTIDARDVTRLAIKEQQALLFAETGEYTQIKLDGSYEGGLGVQQEIISTLVLGDNIDQEVHVYDAPCGRGWQIIIYDTDLGYVQKYSTTTGKTVTAYERYPLTRSYGFGCESDVRTVNW